MTDWNKEAEELGTSNFWKPETGSYQIKFLNDGEPSQYIDPKTKIATDQLNFRVEVRGEERDWTVTKAKTVNSLYGQIALLGRFHGTLVDKTVTLLVKFDKPNNKREYTIQEALPLMEEWNKQQEEKKMSPAQQEKSPKPEQAGQDSPTEKKEEPQGSPTTTLDKIYEKEADRGGIEWIPAEKAVDS